MWSPRTQAGEIGLMLKISRRQTRLRAAKKTVFGGHRMEVRAIDGVMNTGRAPLQRRPYLGESDLANDPGDAISD